MALPKCLSIPLSETQTRMLAADDMIGDLVGVRVCDVSQRPERYGDSGCQFRSDPCPLSHLSDACIDYQVIDERSSDVQANVYR
jgi:hypothetical protein